MEKSPAPIATKEISLKRKTSIEVPIVYNKANDETKAEEPEVLDGEPNKKIVKLSELMTNMDPLEYFSRFLGIPEMILEHLSGKDLITASEVSPSYYNFIASSKLLMKKIQVVYGKNRTLENTEDLIRGSDFSPIYYIGPSKDLMKITVVFYDKCDSEDYNLLKNSSRLYQNIEFKRSRVLIKDGKGNNRWFGDYLTNSELDFLHSKAHEWKNVSLDNVYFRKKLDLWKLLSAIEATVESISVSDFGFLPFEYPSSESESFGALKFPKLKKLKMHHFTVESFGDYLANFLLDSDAIEELNLTDFYGKISKDILTKMLKNFDKLTSLQLSSGILIQLFEDESWKQFQFKLKSLIIGVFIESDIFCCTNFQNFIKSQSDYLENLMLPGLVIDRETFDVIMKMPKLKNFSLKCSEAFLENEVPKISFRFNAENKKP